MIVLDTHVIIWNALKPELLSAKAAQAIKTAKESDGAIFCEISLWEIAMLMQKNRLKIDISYLELVGLLCESYPFRFLGLTPEIAWLSTDLKLKNHKDPADRIIAATAIEESIPLVTADKKLRASKAINTIW